MRITPERLTIFTILTVVALLWFCITVEGAIVTPPVIDDANLTLRYTFDKELNYTNHQFSWESDWEGWGYDTNFAGSTVERSTAWASDGVYSVYVYGYYDTGAGQDNWAHFWISGLNDHYKVSFDINITASDVNHPVIVKINGNTVWSSSTVGEQTVVLWLNYTVTNIDIGTWGSSGSSSFYVDNMVLTPLTPDSTGNYNGSVYNSSRVTGRFGYGLYFNDSTSKVNFTYDATNMTGTVVAWVYDTSWSFQSWDNLTVCPYITISGSTATLSASGKIIDEFRVYNVTLTSEQLQAMQEALRVRTLDELNQTTIANANVSLYNATYYTDIPVDEVTNDAILFHNNVSSYSEYVLSVDATNYEKRNYVVELIDGGLVEQTAYLPPSNQAIIIIFTLVDYTNTFGDARLIIKKVIQSEYKEMHEEEFNFENKVTTYLVADNPYHVYVYNIATGETRYIGTYSSAVSTTAVITIGEQTDIITYSPTHAVSIKVIKGLLPYSNVTINITCTTTNSTVQVVTDDLGRATFWADKRYPYRIDINNSERVVTIYPYEDDYVVIAVPLNYSTTLNQTAQNYTTTIGTYNWSVYNISANLTSRLSPTAKGIVCSLFVWMAMAGVSRAFSNVSFVGLLVLIAMALLGFAEWIVVVLGGVFVFGMYILKRWL
jgi:hypothetical protein